MPKEGITPLGGALLALFFREQERGSSIDEIKRLADEVIEKSKED